MFITEIVHIRKCWELENNHQLYLARYNEHFDCFPKNSLIEAFDITNPRNNKQISLVPRHFVE